MGLCHVSKSLVIGLIGVVLACAPSTSGSAARSDSGRDAYVSARFGQGFLADRPGERLAFSTKGNLKADQGTIEMWIQVEDSIDDSFEWNPLFIAQVEPFQPPQGLILQLVGNGSTLVFVAGTQQSAVATPVRWRRGEVHFVAATWGPDGLALHIDGKHVAKKSGRPGLSSLPKQMSIGGYLWEPAENPGNMIIDELRISGSAKSESTLRKTYKAAGPLAAESGTLLATHLNGSSGGGAAIVETAGNEEGKRASKGASRASKSAKNSSASRSASTPAPVVGGKVRANSGRWELNASNPVISQHEAPRGASSAVRKSATAIWNDPSVLIEDGGYSMWASLGTQGAKNVAIYKLRSDDGKEWAVQNGGKPVLQGGSKKAGDFDWLGVETPAVIRVGSTYHMYYSAYRNGAHGSVTMGHATSSDGLRWKKKGELTSLTRGIGERKGNKWGWLARAEPTAVFHDGVFYLYFTEAKCRRDSCTGTPPALRGINLATSKDGHNFKKQGDNPVVLQSAHYGSSKGWEGYSTPWVLHDGTDFHLFADVFRNQGKDSVQTAITHLKSRDGRRFSEVTADIVTVSKQRWSDGSVRAPSVIVDDGVMKMWYAGDNISGGRYSSKDVMNRNPSAFVGIGYAELK